MKKTDYIKGLQDAILRTHGCASSHLRSAPVKEAFQGKTVWEGVVEVFALEGHPKTRFCYAWAHASGAGGEKTRFVAVLGVPPITSPRAAVRAAIVQQVREERKPS